MKRKSGLEIGVKAAIVTMTGPQFKGVGCRAAGKQATSRPKAKVDGRPMNGLTTVLFVGKKYTITGSNVVEIAGRSGRP
jgi:hypothetical protein